MGVQLEVEAGISIGDIETAVHGGMKKHHEGKPKPSYLRRSGIPYPPIADGTHLTVLDFGSPPNGRMWQVTYITLFGSDDHTAIAAFVAGLYTGNPSSLSLNNLIIPGLAFPSATQISDDVLWIHSNENLCVQTGSATAAGQQLGGNAVVLEWRESEITQRSGR